MATFIPAMEERPPGPPSSNRRLVTRERNNGSEANVRHPSLKFTERCKALSMITVREQEDDRWINRLTRKSLLLRFNKKLLTHNVPFVAVDDAVVILDAELFV
jgi:hypothetical protein